MLQEVFGFKIELTLVQYIMAILDYVSADILKVLELPLIRIPEMWYSSHSEKSQSIYVNQTMGFVQICYWLSKFVMSFFLFVCEFSHTLQAQVWRFVITGLGCWPLV